MNEILNEQINKLKERGLIFKDEANAKEIILRENYNTLTRGYTDVFLSLKKKNHEFDDETYFEELYAIYRFDRDLKNLFFSSLHIIETHIKSYIAYMLIENHGNKNFLQEEFFITKSHEKYIKLVDQISNNIERSYHEHININDKNISPLRLVNYFTFGNITNLEQILKESDKKKLESYTGIPSNFLTEYLRILNIIRNICAHGDILFNFKIYAKLEDKYYRNKLYSVIIILQKLLSEDEFKYFLNNIENLLLYLKTEIDDVSYNNVLEMMGIEKTHHIFRKSITNKRINYKPSPISTDDIILDKDIMDLAEKLAENSHDIWAIRRIDEDWKYGTIRDDTKKTTPDLIPYEELTESEKKYDRDTSIETLKVIQKLGFTISKRGEIK